MVTTDPFAVRGFNTRTPRAPLLGLVVCGGRSPSARPFGQAGHSDVLGVFSRIPTLLKYSPLAICRPVRMETKLVGIPRAIVSVIGLQQNKMNLIHSCGRFNKLESIRRTHHEICSCRGWRDHMGCNYQRK